MRNAPNIHLISPPITGENTCIIRENGERQVWERTIILAHELDYFDLANLWPGNEVWTHNGRFLGLPVMRYLTLRMAGGGAGQPSLAPHELDELIEADNRR